MPMVPGSEGGNPRRQWGQEKSIEAAKQELRAEIRARRRAQPPSANRARRIAEAVLALPAVAQRLQPDATVFAYVSLPAEPPTEVLRAALSAAGCTVLLPIAEAGGVLTWVADPGPSAVAWGVPGQPASPGTLRRIQPPPDPAVIVVPALAVTTNGLRLGQGGGYYDRLLAGLAPVDEGGPLRVAVVGANEVLDRLPTDPHDVTVDVTVVG